MQSTAYRVGHFRQAPKLVDGFSLSRDCWRADPDVRHAAHMTMPTRARGESLPGAAVGRQAEHVLPFRPDVPLGARWAIPTRAKRRGGHAGVRASWRGGDGGEAPRLGGRRVSAGTGSAEPSAFIVPDSGSCPLQRSSRVIVQGGPSATLRDCAADARIGVSRRGS